MIKAECFQLLWSIIHKQALRATDPQKKRSFQHFIENLILDFPCKKCQPHFAQLCADIPLTRFEGSKHKGIDVSYFFWSFHIHNLVNTRLGKNMLLFEDAFDIHTQPACDDCEIDNEKGPKKYNSQISMLISS